MKSWSSNYVQDTVTLREPDDERWQILCSTIALSEGDMDSEIHRLMRAKAWLSIVRSCDCSSRNAQYTLELFGCSQHLLLFKPASHNL
jgi:hypothetical protein